MQEAIICVLSVMLITASLTLLIACYKLGVEVKVNKANERILKLKDAKSNVLERIIKQKDAEICAKSDIISALNSKVTTLNDMISLLDDNVLVKQTKH